MRQRQRVDALREYSPSCADSTATLALGISTRAICHMCAILLLQCHMRNHSVSNKVTTHDGGAIQRLEGVGTIAHRIPDFVRIMSIAVIYTYGSTRTQSATNRTCHGSVDNAMVANSNTKHGCVCAVLARTGLQQKRVQCSCFKDVETRRQSCIGHAVYKYMVHRDIPPAGPGWYARSVRQAFD